MKHTKKTTDTNKIVNIFDKIDVDEFFNFSGQKTDAAKLLSARNIKVGDKIAVFARAIDVLTEVIDATREHCKLRKKKFSLTSKLYDPDNSVWMIDEAFRRLKWLKRSDLDYLETNIGDYNEKADIYTESCDSVLDVVIYIERIASLMCDVCSDD